MHAFRFQTAAVLLFGIALTFTACEPTPMPSKSIEGEAQGTTYHITYYDAKQRDFKTDVDSILIDFDQVLSTYQESSLITKLNQADQGDHRIEDATGYFTDVFMRAYEVYVTTEGAFDPTVKPLASAWGWGLEKAEEMDSTKVDSLLYYVSFAPNRITLRPHEFKEDGTISSGTVLYKVEAGIELDFNAIAQGYSVDVLCSYLAANGITDYMVELGGELRVAGKKSDGSPWKIGIDKPEENAETRNLQATIEISDRSLATSGNYRKFYEKDGVKYSHTLDPFTGYPVTHALLSATVLAEECSTADAYATAFMVMGLDKTKAFLEQHEAIGLDVYLIYSGENGEMLTWSSNGLASQLNEL